MKAFQNLVTIEKKHQTKLMSLEGFLSEKRDFANIYDLIDQIKENVFERENYDQFLLILQYLIMIPKNDQGDELWDSINEILEKLVSKKENLSPDFFSIKKKDSKTLDMIQKKMGELEQLLTAKEEEIKQVIIIFININLNQSF